MDERINTQDLVDGYAPDESLDIHPDVTLSSDHVEDLDPITYEVLRHRLWSINREHGEILTQISGAPAAYFAQDFNPTILTEDGEIVFSGPFKIYFSPVTETLVKWILENRSGNPGINEGDMFLANDPWIGATHQPDVSICLPLFVDDELFCWLIDSLHQYDVGGITPGSFCPDADDVFSDPDPIPPIKILEEGEWREDVKRMYLRQSRNPQMVNLDLNAQVAALREMQERIEELISTHGHRTVKGAMYQIIRDSEKKFSERISNIPDGTWRTRGFEVGPTLDDNEVFRGEIQLTKNDDRLIFEDEGTSENIGSINVTYPAFRAGLVAAFAPTLMFDQLWTPGGIYRHLEIETSPGSRFHAKHPSSVSASTGSTLHFAISLVVNVVSRMLSSSPDTRDLVLSDNSNGSVVLSQAGVDQWGNEFGTINLDVMGSGFAARTDRDGVDVGGQVHSPIGKLPNIEQNEQQYPLLYLSRSIATDAGGHGKHRGGAGLKTSWIPHKTDEIETVVFGSGGLVPLTMGIGAYPGAPFRPRILRDSDIKERLEGSSIVQDLSDLDGELDLLPPKTETSQLGDDVMEVRYTSTAGYGDPLERPPSDVVEDVENGVISRDVAESIYGVVITGDGSRLRPDTTETKERRRRIRQRRLQESTRENWNGQTD